MARKNIRRFGSGGKGSMWKAWAIAKANMEIRRNPNFMAVKCQTTRNNNDGVVTMAPKVVLDVQKSF